MKDEDAQQRITYLLQEIDANICAAHRSATEICGTVRRHHQILRQIHEASRVWRPLFDSFTQQPSSRRVTRTPSRLSKPSTPGSTRSTATTQQRYINHRRIDQEAEEEDIEEETLFASKEQTFKTTTLKKNHPLSHANRPADDDSLDVSTNSDNLPRMSRTPYVSKSAVRLGAMTQESTSTLSSSDCGHWSPPRTGIISTDQLDTADAEPRHISTPPSAISSVEYSSNSPGISRNLMKLGAFEYTPPREKKIRSNDEEKKDEDVDDSYESPLIPEFTTVRLSTTVDENSSDIAAELSVSDGASNRKRKLSDLSKTLQRPVYPKTLYPEKATSPFTSPSLRRKYCSRSNTSSPNHHRHSLSEALISPRRRYDAALDDDTPKTPDLASPLLRTQLKAMTPNTPLSNRLVGASLDVGTVSQEARLLNYDDSFNAGEPTPKFELSLLPAVFQRGVGAVQVSTLYNKFQGTGGNKPAISVDQLAELLPDYGKEKIEILLDTLVSRRLLRPFVIEGTMFWQMP
ncbi:putative DASH complex subunit Ask1 protein [Plasmopara halstedii]